MGSFISFQLGSNIVHQYFKKDLEGMKILMKVDIIHLTAVELIVHGSGEITWNEIEIAEDGVERLAASGFQPSGALEFNLYDAGLAGSQTEK
jgi:hypothetical protein